MDIITEFENIQNNMETNGYAFFNKEAFLNKSDAVCYIPENADSLDDCFNYYKLKQEVTDFLNNNPDYLEEHETTEEQVLLNMFENLEWTYPSTYLNELI